MPTPVSRALLALSLAALIAALIPSGASASKVAEVRVDEQQQVVRQPGLGHRAQPAPHGPAVEPPGVGLVVHRMADADEALASRRGAQARGNR